MRVRNVSFAAVLLVLVAAGGVWARADSPPLQPSEGLVVTGRQPGGWPPPTCVTSGALVEFHSSDGFSYNDDLIIRSSGRGSMCWGRQPGAESGRIEFVAGRKTMDRLASLLVLVYCGEESPDPQVPMGADTPVSTLAYYGPDESCGDSTAGAREAAFRDASELVGDLVATALGSRQSR